MTWVKVCGLTRETDVSATVEAGADAIGFVLAEDSPRRISVERAASLADGVPVLRILVTVDATIDFVAEAVSTTGADGVQPHGVGSEAVAEWGQHAGLFVLRPVSGGESIGTVPDGQMLLLDSATGSRHGGTGKPLDWGALRRPERPFILAGGLGPGNVARAIEMLDPWGVDASSHLEASPGVKDPAKVAAFVEEAKQR